MGIPTQHESPASRPPVGTHLKPPTAPGGRPAAHGDTTYTVTYTVTFRNDASYIGEKATVNAPCEDLACARFWLRLPQVLLPWGDIKRVEITRVEETTYVSAGTAD